MIIENCTSPLRAAKLSTKVAEKMVKVVNKPLLPAFQAHLKLLVKSLRLLIATPSCHPSVTTVTPVTFGSWQR